MPIDIIKPFLELMEKAEKAPDAYGARGDPLLTAAPRNANLLTGDSHATD